MAYLMVSACVPFTFFLVGLMSRNLEYLLSWQFLTQGGLSISLSLDFSAISVMFFLVVWVITLSIFLYSLSYMEGEGFFYRFIALMAVFVLSMVLMIFSSNFFMIILGWDGLGISSFLLVIYYNNLNSLNAGLITVFTNRLGDIGLIILMFFFLDFNTWEFMVFNSGDKGYSLFFSFLLFLGCSTKSAQVPFSSWLPAAMSAPTPVSSLVHSSTLVTAGVFLLMRFEVIFISDIFFSVGLLTCLLASFSAFLEFDMKKIVALSTLSHLSMMVCMLGLQMGSLMFTHLVFHAFFKALLFMSMGLMIHLACNYQDSRKIKNLVSVDFLNSTVMVAALLSLCGVPFLTGFFSKDLFLELLLLSGGGLIRGAGMFLLGMFSFVYSVRILKKFLLQFDFSFCCFWVYKNYLNYFTSMVPLLVLSVVGGKFIKVFFLMNLNIIFLELGVKLFFYVSILAIVGGSLMGMRVPLVKSTTYAFLYSMMFLVMISRVGPVGLFKNTGNKINRAEVGAFGYFVQRSGNIFLGPLYIKPKYYGVFFSAFFQSFLFLFMSLAGLWVNVF